MATSIAPCCDANSSDSDVESMSLGRFRIVRIWGFGSSWIIGGPFKGNVRDIK